MSYHTARHYALWLARWCSADPIDVSGGLNLYRVVRNNPLVYRDDSGTDESWFRKLVKRSEAWFQGVRVALGITIAPPPPPPPVPDPIDIIEPGPTPSPPPGPAPTGNPEPGPDTPDTPRESDRLSEKIKKGKLPRSTPPLPIQPPPEHVMRGSRYDLDELRAMAREQSLPAPHEIHPSLQPNPDLPPPFGSNSPNNGNTPGSGSRGGVTAEGGQGAGATTPRVRVRSSPGSSDTGSGITEPSQSQPEVVTSERRQPGNQGTVGREGQQPSEGGRQGPRASGRGRFVGGRALGHIGTVIDVWTVMDILEDPRLTVGEKISETGEVAFSNTGLGMIVNPFRPAIRSILGPPAGGPVDVRRLR